MPLDIKPGDTLSFIVFGWWTGRVDFIYVANRTGDRKMSPPAELDVNVQSGENSAELFLERECKKKGLVATRVAPGYHTYKIRRYSCLQSMSLSVTRWYQNLVTRSWWLNITTLVQ